MSTALAPAVTTTARSVLDKPLNELTEDDLSQLTREDCRRYLKGKGMRRPSWNKSQAIQQVIALKSLLEPPPPSPPADPPRFTSAAPQPSLPKATSLSPTEIPTPNVISNSPSPVNELSPDPVSAKANEGRPQPPLGPCGSDLPREADFADFAPAVADHRADSHRDVDVSNLSVGQMTIFYCGKVNVYDGVPTEKAQTIMQLAASSIQFLQDELINGKSAQWGNPGRFPGSSVKVDMIPAGGTAVSHPVQTGKMREYIQQYRQERNVPHEADIDGHTTRQVSLQRYLEKRKDRGRFKTRKKTGSSSSLEMYLNPQMRTQVVSGQSSPSGVSSPTQPGISRAQCTSIENLSKNAGCATDLND